MIVGVCQCSFGKSEVSQCSFGKSEVSGKVAYATISPNFYVLSILSNLQVQWSLRFSQCATISPHLCIYCHYKCSVTHHSSSCTPTSGVPNFVCWWMWWSYLHWFCCKAATTCDCSMWGNHVTKSLPATSRTMTAWMSWSVDVHPLGTSCGTFCSSTAHSRQPVNPPAGLLTRLLLSVSPYQPHPIPPPSQQ